MSKGTPGTKALTDAGATFEVVTYEYDPNADHVGLHAASSVGVEPARLLKTLMTTVDAGPVCVVLASDREVNMKKLAAAVGGKSAAMMKPADAERVTGYKVGGVSPFGRKKRTPIVLDRAALDHAQVLVNAGGRGVLARLAPTVLTDLFGAIAADVT